MRGGEGAQGLEEAVAFEEPEKGGGFAARDDEAVESFELLRFANKHRLRTDVLKSAGVCVVVALDGKHANAWPGLLFRSSLLANSRSFPQPSKHPHRIRLYQPRVCRSWLSSRPATARPFIVPVTCSLTSARIFGSL